MTELQDIAQPFVDMAHRIVWASAATVDRKNRPRSRVLHPIWDWDGQRLTGHIATVPTAAKRAHLAHSPCVSLNYWAASQDTCLAECRASLLFDDTTRTRIWNRFKEAPAPVGYDPSAIPFWNAPTDETFAVIELSPWQLRVFPGTVLLEGEGDVLEWKQS